MEFVLSALSNIKSYGDWQAVRKIRRTSHGLSFRNGTPQSLATQKDEGLMVEIFYNGQFAYGATSDLSEAGVVRAAEMAFKLARASAAHTVHQFPKDLRQSNKGRFATKPTEPFTPEHLSTLKEVLAKACSHLKVSDQIISTRAGIGVDEIQSFYVSSSGAEIEQNFVGISSHMEATAQKGSEIQSRSDKGMAARCYQGGFEALIPDQLEARCQLAGEQAIELLGAQDCPNETMDLILMPDQMMLQIHESIGHPLELDRILGDERNYAGWSFVNPEDFGNLQYGSELMNISFDPTDPLQYATYAFDDTGHEATKEYLIKDGKLLRGLGGLESQARLGTPGVANSRAQSWNRAPIDRMANINLEAGESSLNEIISSTKKGVLMESNRSWSIDDYRNKFQFGCEYAKLIEDGRVTKTIKNPNYRGSTLSFWRSMDKVGDRSTYESFGTPYCGKGEPNQIIRVSHGSPVCRFTGIEVFGGAS